MFVVIQFFFGLWIITKIRCYKRLRHFLRARASIAIARISYSNSVCPSVRPSRHGTNPRPGEIETSSFHRMTAYCLEYFVTKFHPAG